MIRIGGPDRASELTSTKSAGKKRKSGASRAKGTADQVHVADATGLRETVQAMLADMPDLRLDHIEEIRSALESGSYNIDSRKVASRIVANALAERPW